MAAAAGDFYLNTSPDSLLDYDAIGKEKVDIFSRCTEVPGIHFALPTTNDVSSLFIFKIFKQHRN